MPARFDQLPTDPDTLRALLLAERERHADELAAAHGEVERLIGIIKELQRYRFGRRAERLDADQLALALEDLEQTLAVAEAGEEKDGNKPTRLSRQRRINRGALPPHLPREEVVIDVADKTCPCCGGLKHRIGEDVSERLDVTPAQFKVLVLRRPKYACRACEGEVSQAPAPERLIENGIPTEALVAHVIVAKYADHLPLYRQAQIYARQGINLDRSTLADWVGRAAFALRPVYARLFEGLKSSTKLFADETTAPVLDPGRGRTKTGQLWAYAAMIGPGADPSRPAWPTSMRQTASMNGRPLTLRASRASCRSMAMAPMPASPSAAMSSLLFAGATCGGASMRSRRRPRRRSRRRHSCASVLSMRSRPTSVAARPRNATRAVLAQQAARRCAEALVRSQLAAVSGKSTIAEAIRYALTRWDRLTRFLDDGRVEIDSNAVERAIRPIALGRKNHLFAGSDGGAEHRAILASLIATCKMNSIDPQNYLANMLAKIVDRHP